MDSQPSKSARKRAKEDKRKQDAEATASVPTRKPGYAEEVTGTQSTPAVSRSRGRDDRATTAPEETATPKRGRTGVLIERTGDLGDAASESNAPSLSRESGVEKPGAGPTTPFKTPKPNADTSTSTPVNRHGQRAPASATKLSSPFVNLGVNDADYPKADDSPPPEEGKSLWEMAGIPPRSSWTPKNKVGSEGKGVKNKESDDTEREVKQEATEAGGKRDKKKRQDGGDESNISSRSKEPGQPGASGPNERGRGVKNEESDGTRREVEKEATEAEKKRGKKKRQDGGDDTTVSSRPKEPGQTGGSEPKEPGREQKRTKVVSTPGGNTKDKKTYRKGVQASERSSAEKSARKRAEHGDEETYQRAPSPPM